MEQVIFSTEFIKLQQFLKLAGVIGQGSDVKILLGEGSISVNGEIASQRGKKIYHGDKVEVAEMGVFEAVSKP